MDFTFGIISSQPNHNFLQMIIDSISNENIKNFEIIIVGGCINYTEDNLQIIKFDENIKPGWITRKKNIIIEQAKYDNIVFLHDYIKLNPGWYNGFLDFGNKFSVCMTPIQNIDGTRYRDWTLCGNDFYDMGVLKQYDPTFLLPYNVTHLSKFMYISGAYWVAKTEVMRKFPLDESLGWSESEDVEWSRRIRNQYEFSINEYSSVKLLKYKSPIFTNVTSDVINFLNTKL